VCSICSRSTLGAAELPHVYMVSRPQTAPPSQGAGPMGGILWRYGAKGGPYGLLLLLLCIHACRLWIRHPSVGVFRLGAVQQPHPTTQNPTTPMPASTTQHPGHDAQTRPPCSILNSLPHSLPNSMGHTQSTWLHLHTADPDLHATTVTAARCSSTWGGQHLPRSSAQAASLSCPGMPGCWFCQVLQPFCEVHQHSRPCFEDHQHNMLHMHLYR
jgi:hypothetical protein